MALASPVAAHANIFLQPLQSTVVLAAAHADKFDYKAKIIENLKAVGNPETMHPFASMSPNFYIKGVSFEDLDAVVSSIMDETGYDLHKVILDEGNQIQYTGMGPDAANFAMITIARMEGEEYFIVSIISS